MRYVPIQTRRLVVYSSIVFTLLLVSAVSNASAHSPITEDFGNDSLSNALIVENPKKSWAYYQEIGVKGSGKYFRMELDSGDRLYADVFIPAAQYPPKKGEPAFLPGLIVVGPKDSLPEENATFPQYLEKPNGTAFLRVDGNMPESPEYEPFTPSAYYHVAKININVRLKGEYFLIVHSNTTRGSVGLAIGYEESFALEWVSVPFNIISVHLWEGQNIALVTAPLLATLLIGMVAIRIIQKTVFDRIQSSAAALSGLLFIGGSAVSFVQMCIALSYSPRLTHTVWLTVLLACIPLLFGMIIIYTTVTNIRGFSIKQSVLFIVFGILGIIVWGGVLFGPVLAFVAPFLPPVAVHSHPPKIVSGVELETLCGRWYCIAVIPANFRKTACGLRATVSLRGDGSLDVIKEYWQPAVPSESRKKYTVAGRAFVIGKKTNAIFKLRYKNKIFGRHRWLIDLDSNLGYAIVATPGRSRLWILSRNTKMDGDVYNDLKLRAQKNGYDTDRLVMIKQPP